jgi:hypothetical protein
MNEETDVSGRSFAIGEKPPGRSQSLPYMTRPMIFTDSIDPRGNEAAITEFHPFQSEPLPPPPGWYHFSQNMKKYHQDMAYSSVHLHELRNSYVQRLVTFLSYCRWQHPPLMVNWCRQPTPLAGRVGVFCRRSDGIRLESVQVHRQPCSVGHRPSSHRQSM